VNAPLPQHIIPLTTAFSLGLIVQDLETAKDHLDPRMTPLEADIAREEEAARAARTATPEEVFKTLRDNTEHVRQTVNQMVFSKWLQDREWPEEQSQKVSQNGMTWIMKLFKAHDGFAVKWVPIDDGKILPHRAAYEVFWFTSAKKDM
jgi:ribonuclease HI